MKKRIWIPLLLVVVILAGLGICIADRNAPSADIPGAEYTLFVNGRKVRAATEVYIRYDGGSYVEIPLITVMTALGAEVEWTSDTTASIEFKGERYILDTENDTLCEEGDDRSFFCPPPGSTYECHNRSADGEYVVDNNYLWRFYRAIDVDYRIESAGQKVYIDFIKE